MLFFKQRRIKRERENLYQEMLGYLRSHYQTEPKFSLPDNPNASSGQESRPDTISPAAPEAKGEPQFKYSMSDYVAETVCSPRVVVVNGDPVYLEGSSNMPTFTNEVKRLMRKRGLTGTDLCKRILMDRRLWSKLTADVEYQPSKETAVAICIALRLTVEQADELLQCAGYTLSETRKQDVVMRYFLENGIYDVDVINDMLYRFGLRCIGTKVRE